MAILILAKLDRFLKVYNFYLALSCQKNDFGLVIAFVEKSGSCLRYCYCGANAH